MKSKKNFKINKNKKNIQRKFRGRIVLGIFFLIVFIFGNSVNAMYSLPEDLAITWRGNVGVLGDIPIRTTICATLNPSGADDTTQIKNAIASCPVGQVVKLNAGTFVVSSSLSVKAGTTLRGAGMGETILQGVQGMIGQYFIAFRSGNSSFDLSNAPHIDIISGLQKGSNTITTNSPHGWVVGDYVAIDQLNDGAAEVPVTSSGTSGSCTWCGRSAGARSLSQTVKITEVPSNTSIKFEIPLYWNFNINLSPQGTKLVGVIENTGLEDLTIDNSLSGNGSQSNNGTIFMDIAANSWLHRVEAIGSYQNMIRMYGGYRNTIRGCKFHEGIPALPTNGPQYDTSRAYGINLSQWLSASLVENNEFYHLAMSVILNGPASGNVVSYNYFHDNYNSVTWQQDAITHHGGHPMMNLYEGNYIDGLVIGADNVWGTSSHNTIFRNKITNSMSFISRTWAIDFYQKIRFFNIIGNVLGDSNDTIYELDNVNFSILNARAIYKFGYVSGGDSSAIGNDPQVKATTLRHGNWDSVTEGTSWNNADDHLLPTSLYLTSRPFFLNNTSWPLIGPDISPMFPSPPTNGVWEGELALPAAPAAPNGLNIY